MLMKTPQEHLDFEDWVDYQFPFSIGPTTFDKVFYEDGKFYKYSIDIIDKMWKAWSATKHEDTKQLVAKFKERVDGIYTEGDTNTGTA